VTSALKDMIRNPTDAELSLVERFASFAPDGRRERLFEAFAATGLPHRRLENWRWSDFKAAVRDLPEYPHDALPDPLAVAGVPELFLRPGRLGEPSNVPGAKIRTLADPMAVQGAEDMPLGALAAALADGGGLPSVIVVEVTGPEPARLHMLFEGRHAFHAARVVVLLRPGTELDLTESHIGGAHFSTALIEFKLEAGAKLRRTVYQRGGASEVQAITALIEQDAGAETVQTVLSFGAKICRIETRLVHQQTGSKATLNAAYLAGNGFHADITTHVRHGARACVTRQVTKGAVLDGGRGVFQGKFHVPKNTGQQTDASMQHNALLLEDGAEVFAKPELEIHADDVQCAHGNTSGELDANQLFYMRQRGIPLEMARALLTEAFIAEALEGAGEAEAALRAEAGAWLAR
jgi:Fe-S cluster assembly protein SufD